MKKIAIIGGGAAGMMAGIVLARKGYAPVIFEKNDKLGRKLFITGKGRCNLTNDCDNEQFIKNIVSNSKFMMSSINGFSTFNAMSFFEELGLKIKTERGGRVFPISDHSSDVINVLYKELERLGVEIKYNTVVKKIDSIEYVSDNPKEKYEKKVIGLEYEYNKNIYSDEFDKIVVATGGKSYPLTGSTGDGIKWAIDMGISTVKTYPALVPIEIVEDFCNKIMGLALKNVKVSFITKQKNKDKVIYSELGEMLFTHYGISGPVVLSGSSYLNKYLENEIVVSIDLKPGLSMEQLDDRVLRDFSKNLNKQFRNSLDELLPRSLIPVIIEFTQIDPYKKVNEITKAERLKLVEILKNFTLHVKQLRDYNEAIITKGGVNVKEINPNNMEAKRVKNLYFIGEVLDVDALTGGYNLQVAWSTAYALNNIE